MKSYNHFTDEERERLLVRRGEGRSMRSTSRELGQNASS